MKDGDVMALRRVLFAYRGAKPPRRAAAHLAWTREEIALTAPVIAFVEAMIAAEREPSEEELYAIGRVRKRAKVRGKVRVPDARLFTTRRAA